MTIRTSKKTVVFKHDQASMERPASWASSHKMPKEKTESPQEKADRQAIERGEGEGMIIGSK